MGRLDEVVLGARSLRRAWRHLTLAGGPAWEGGEEVRVLGKRCLGKVRVLHRFFSGDTLLRVVAEQSGE